MATKPKAKPVTIPKTATKVAPKPTSEAAVKTAPMVTQMPAPKAAPKAIQTAAAKQATKPASEATPKPAPKAVQKPTAKPTAEVKPAVAVKKKVELKPEPGPMQKADVKPVAKAVLKTAITTPTVLKWLEIRVILEKIKEDTLREISKSVKNGTDAIATNEPGGDIYDQASSERDRELGLLLGDREREKLHSIDEALLRIDEDEYGICEECDEDIPLGRLKAMPFTRHCVKCKSDLEKLQAQTKRFEEDRAYREIPLGSEEEEG